MKIKILRTSWQVVYTREVDGVIEAGSVVVDFIDLTALLSSPHISIEEVVHIPTGKKYEPERLLEIAKTAIIKDETLTIEFP